MRLTELYRPKSLAGGVVAGLVFAVVSLCPRPAAAQCNTNTVVQTMVGPGSVYNRVFKTFPGATNCALTVNSAFACTPMSGMVTMLTAVANPTTSTNPYCRWRCGAGVYCGTGTAPELITISGVDGLPVELMDFSVEPETTAQERSARAHPSD